MLNRCVINLLRLKTAHESKQTFFNVPNNAQKCVNTIWLKKKLQAWGWEKNNTIDKKTFTIQIVMELSHKHLINDKTTNTTQTNSIQNECFSANEM